MNQRFERIDQRFERIDQRLEETNGRISVLHEDVLAKLALIYEGQAGRRKRR